MKLTFNAAALRVTGKGESKDDVPKVQETMLGALCSYLLIGFYFERQSASNAANKAFITNRVGDAGFIIGLMIKPASPTRLVMNA